MATKKVKDREHAAFNFDNFQKSNSWFIWWQKLSGEDGVLAPLVQHLLNAAIKGRKQRHISEDKVTGC